MSLPYIQQESTILDFNEKHLQFQASSSPDRCTNEGFELAPKQHCQYKWFETNATST